jgi:hypothetical protein
MTLKASKFPQSGITSRERLAILTGAKPCKECAEPHLITSDYRWVVDAVFWERIRGRKIRIGISPAEKV